MGGCNRTRFRRGRQRRLKLRRAGIAQTAERRLAPALEQPLEAPVGLFGAEVVVHEAAVGDE